MELEHGSQLCHAEAEYKIIVEPIFTVQNINSSLHIEFSPFTSLGDLVYVNMAWWQSLSIRQRADIIFHFGYEYGFCLRPKFTRNKDDINNKAFWQFHAAYSQSYSCCYWHEYIQANHAITTLSKSVIEKKDFNPLVKSAIESFISKNKDTGIFYKINESKYTGEIPVFTYEDLIKDILSNQKVIDLFNKQIIATIILEPWNYDIETTNEYRVIIFNRKIVGICQQQCYKFIGLDETKVTLATTTILKLWNSIKNRVHYSSCVLDVWINNEAHIININPGEGWSNSESGLFNWISDKNKIWNTQNAQNAQNTQIRSSTISPTSSPPLISDLSNSSSNEIFYSIYSTENIVYVRYIDSKSPLLKSMLKSSSIESLKL